MQSVYELRSAGDLDVWEAMSKGPGNVSHHPHYPKVQCFRVACLCTLFVPGVRSARPPSSIPTPCFNETRTPQITLSPKTEAFIPSISPVTNLGHIIVARRGPRRLHHPEFRPWEEPGNDLRGDVVLMWGYLHKLILRSREGWFASYSFRFPRRVLTKT